MDYGMWKVSSFNILILKIIYSIAFWLCLFIMKLYSQNIFFVEGYVKG